MSGSDYRVMQRRVPDDRDCYGDAKFPQNVCRFFTVVLGITWPSREPTISRSTTHTPQFMPVDAPLMPLMVDHPSLITH